MAGMEIFWKVIPYYLPYCSCGIDYLVSGKNRETEL